MTTDIAKTEEPLAAVTFELVSAPKDGPRVFSFHGEHVTEDKLNKQQQARVEMFDAEQELAKTLDRAQRSSKATATSMAHICVGLYGLIVAAENMQASGYNEEVRIFVAPERKETKASPGHGMLYLDRDSVMRLWRGDMKGAEATAFIDGVIGLSPLVRADNAAHARDVARFKSISKDTAKIVEASELGQKIASAKDATKVLRMPTTRALAMLGKVISDGTPLDKLDVTSKNVLRVVEKDEDTGDVVMERAINDKDVTESRTKARKDAGNYVERATKTSTANGNGTTTAAQPISFESVIGHAVQSIEAVAKRETPPTISERRRLMDVIAAATACLADMSPADLQAIIDLDKSAMAELAKRAA